MNDRIHRVVITGAGSGIGLDMARRVGEVRDTSEAALYLATAGFVTGTTLAVDGGYSHGR